MRACTNLHVTFRDIKRGNSGMGDTARKDTTKHALCVVGCVVWNGTTIPRRGQFNLECAQRAPRQRLTLRPTCLMERGQPSVII